MPGQVAPAALPEAPYQRVNKALEQLGDVIEQRGIEIKKEVDLTTATDAYNSFRDLERDKKMELKAKTGKDAQTAMQEYQDWSSDAVPEFMERLANRTQHRIFGADATSTINRDLDTLAAHEATELRFWKEQIKTNYKGTRPKLEKLPWGDTWSLSSRKKPNLSLSQLKPSPRGLRLILDRKSVV